MKYLFYLLGILLISVSVLSCDDNTHSSDNCGDGVVDIGEECDGNDFGGNTCETLGYHSEELACNEDCTFDLTSCLQSGKCGDGEIQVNSEDCDGENLGLKTCENMGHGTGELSCTSDCIFDYSNCSGVSVCGNGIIEVVESCDGTDLNGSTCESLGYYGGNLACNSEDCSFDKSSCETFGECGDNNIQSGYEDCEGNNMNSQSCESLFNMGRGTLLCDNSCQFDTSGCDYCGDGVINGAEVCDSTSFSPDTCYNFGFFTGIATCDSSCIANDAGCRNIVQWGTATLDQGRSLAIDSVGNIYVTGVTEGALDGTPIGDTDLFLTKYDSWGQKQWTRLFGSTVSDAVQGIAIDSLDNIYIVGYTGGSMPSNTSAGMYDVFLTKYDSSGSFQWTTQWGTPNDDFGNSLTINSVNQIYVTGGTEGSIDGSTIADGKDIFLTKLDSVGQIFWTKQWGAGNWDQGTGVIVHPDTDLIYVTGVTNGSLDGTTPASGYDLFLTEYNAAGIKLWTRQLGGSGDSFGNGITVDPSGNLYITGSFNGTFDGISSNGENDIFLTRYSSLGEKQWTAHLGGTGDDFGNSVTIDSFGNLYVLGTTNGTIDGTSTAGLDDIVLAKFNSSGVYMGVNLWGESGGDSASCVAIDSSAPGYIYITGDTDGSLDGIQNAGQTDVFLIRVDPNTL